jgi:hypothetical protein
MKKIGLLMLSFLFVSTLANAQVMGMEPTHTLKDINLKFITSEPNVNVLFFYDGLKVDGRLEEDYLNDIKSGKEKSQMGKGEEWSDIWFGNRIKYYEPEFLKAINAKLKKFKVNYGDHPDSKYTILIHITDIEPGWYAYVANKHARIKFNMHIVETADMSTSLASIAVTAVGNSGRNGLPTVAQRVSLAYRFGGSFVGYNVLYKRGYGLK